MATTTSRQAPDSVDDRQVAQQLAATETRLIEHYRDRDGVTDEHVRSIFGSVRDRFGQAKIRSFLPILIERRVRAEFRR